MNEIRRLIRACRFSWDGLSHGVRTEAAIRTEAIVLAPAVLLAAAIADTPTRFVALVGAVLFVMVVELLNTAIEKLADRVEPDIDPIIKVVKDMGSAAVTLSLIVAGGTWISILVEIRAGH